MDVQEDVRPGAEKAAGSGEQYMPGGLLTPTHTITVPHTYKHTQIPASMYVSNTFGWAHRQQLPHMHTVIQAQSRQGCGSSKAALVQ